MDGTSQDDRPGHQEGTRLAQGMLLRVAVMLAVAVAAVGFFALTWDSDTLYNVLVLSLGMSDEQALGLLALMRNNSLPLLIAVAALVLFVGYHASLKPYCVRYFSALSHGIDALTDSGRTDIALPAKMAQTEAKLNQVKHELERRDMEARLAEQRKNDLVMYLAHDIRTPLTSVIGYLSLLDEVPDMPDAQRRKYIGIALRKAQRLDTLTDEFFDITRYNMQTIALDRQRLDLTTLLMQLSEEFHPQLEEHGNTVRLDLPQRLEVDADAQKLARVFNNLLRNAISYGTRGTDIAIQAWDDPDQGMACVSVSSVGRTISPDKLTRIFDKFYRLDDSRGSSSGGSGLGLAIAKQIVELHGGAIGASSVDGTTTFVVSLPTGVARQADPIASVRPPSGFETHTK
ncbi:sensor histidine kinase [Bifidobacterium eulemuris]|nr:HAMP domain-containing sensor histidine kinase [Bifidobacterium eulemuris]QOL31364.1 HAMP domain-containing histidine kinase [Bifidobacterium eulemuris]